MDIYQILQSIGKGAKLPAGQFLYARPLKYKGRGCNYLIYRFMPSPYFLRGEPVPAKRVREGFKNKSKYKYETFDTAPFK